MCLYNHILYTYIYIYILKIRHAHSPCQEPGNQVPIEAPNSYLSLWGLIKCYVKVRTTAWFPCSCTLPHRSCVRRFKHQPNMHVLLDSMGCPLGLVGPPIVPVPDSDDENLPNSLEAPPAGLEGLPMPPSAIDIDNNNDGNLHGLLEDLPPSGTLPRSPIRQVKSSTQTILPTVCTSLHLIKLFSFIPQSELVDFPCILKK